MKCKSCGEVIELRMKKALKANECPYCGGGILDKESMQQFLDLHSVLDPQHFTDSQEHDLKIKEKVVRILMEYMKCIKLKDVKQDDDIVKLNEKTSPRSISATQASQPKEPLITEQKKMRKDMYVEAYKEQYGEEPQVTESDEEPLPDDIEAAKGVVFSNADDPEITDKVERLRKVAGRTTGNKPITRVQ